MPCREKNSMVRLVWEIQLTVFLVWSLAMHRGISKALVSSIMRSCLTWNFPNYLATEVSSSLLHTMLGKCHWNIFILFKWVFHKVFYFRNSGREKHNLSLSNDLNQSFVHQIQKVNSFYGSSFIAREASVAVENWNSCALMCVLE